MKIGLLVEGPSDDDAITILIRRVVQAQGPYLKTEVRKFQGHGDLLNAHKVAGVTRSLLRSHSDIDRVIAVIDSDCRDERYGLVAQVAQQLKQSNLTIVPYYCIAVHALEGWLIADPVAVSKVLGREVSPPHPQEECDPVRWLRNTFKRRDKPYNKILHGREIAELLDMKQASQRNSSFAAFLQLLGGP